jgi:hypothetical protein
MGSRRCLRRCLLVPACRRTWRTRRGNIVEGHSGRDAPLSI